MKYLPQVIDGHNRQLFTNRHKKPAAGAAGVSDVAQPGFEPRQTDPESVVLPLYYWAMEVP